VRASTYPLIDVAEAHARVLRLTPVLPVEGAAILDCFGRVLAEDLVAPRDLPPWPASAVDGYAIRSADAGSRLRIVGESAAGHPFTGVLEPGTAARILTGGVLPEGADAVVMVEETDLYGDLVSIRRRVATGANFHQPGADLKRGEVALRAGRALGPAELGLAAAMGFAALPVRRFPRVALMSTGDELVEVGDEPGPGQIVDSNRFALLGALSEAGAEVRLLGIAPDDPDRLRALLRVGPGEVLLRALPILSAA